MLSYLEMAFAICGVIFTTVGAYYLSRRLNTISAKKKKLQKELVDGLKNTYSEQREINEFMDKHFGCEFYILNPLDQTKVDNILNDLDIKADKMNKKLDSLYQVCEEEARHVKEDIPKKYKKKRFW